jgi:outer membrane protein TolC
VIVGALRDVEDAVVRLDAEQTRRQSLGRAVDAARSSLVIAQDQYRTGFVTFVNVLEAQYALLGAEDQLTLSQALVLTDVVAAYKALGGGWSP